MASFSEGAERVVYRCSEVLVDRANGPWALRVGSRLVAKETRFEQHLNDPDFHKSFCRTQAEAQALAKSFNVRLQGLHMPWPDLMVRFLPLCVYKVR